MPTPIRWAGLEFIRVARWLDQTSSRAIDTFRASPAWFFVTLVGLSSIGLTFMLFISMMGPQSRQALASQEQMSASTVSGREHLEKIDDWTVQDKWRIAHLFVPNRPAHHPKNIRIDSRLRSAVDENRNLALNDSPRDQKTFKTSKRDIDVRLDLSRPKVAAQGYRTVERTTTDSELTSRTKRVSQQIDLRQPRALVQAAWEFGSECLSSYYSGLPVRRSIPVPVPVTPAEPKIPLEPRRQGTPHVSLELEMYRHTTVAGLFPPGARIVSRSKRSEYPPGSLQFEIGLSAYHDSEWFKFNTSPHKRTPDVLPYTGLGLFNPQQHEMSFGDDNAEFFPSSAEVGLRVEFVTPDSVSAGEVQKSRLSISNEGSYAVPRIEIEDLIPASETVVSADPEARVVTNGHSQPDGDDKQLHREIQGLEPGESQSFDLRWITKVERRYIQRTRVVTHAAVASVTEVSRPEQPPEPHEPAVEEPIAAEPEPLVPKITPETKPSFACDFRYLDMAYLGDEVHLEIAVRNTGDVDLHDVVVQVNLPDQLSHESGNELVFNAGTIPVSGRNQTVLKVSAVGKGQAVNVLKVEATEKIHARGEAHIMIVDRTKPAQPAPQPAAPVPAKPTPAAPAPVISPCYCNQISMTDSFDFFSIP